MDIRSVETAEERREMTKQYWNLYSSPTIESMLLSHEGKTFDEAERNEILSTLPPFEGSKVLDLGAGIGRFTSRFAATASHVTATDLMEPFIEENKRTNQHFGNITFICDDMRNLDFPDASFDLVFSNWLFIYLTNPELEVFLSKILRWLKPGGHFFFKESCYHPGGSIIRPSNPSVYRIPLEYLLFIRKATVDGSKFILKTTKNVFTLTAFQGNAYQVCFLVQKANEDNTDAVFERCVNPSFSYEELCKAKPLRKRSLIDVKDGESLLKNVAENLGLCAGQRVLLIGCDGDEVPIYLVENFKVFLHVIIESPVLLCQAIENQGKLDNEIKKRMHYESSNWIETVAENCKYDRILCFNLMLPKGGVVETITKATQCLKENGRLSLLLFVDDEKYEQEDTRHFQTTEEILTSLKAGGLTLQQTKKERDFVLNYVSSLQDDLRKVEKLGPDEGVKDEGKEINEELRLLRPTNINLLSVIANK